MTRWLLSILGGLFIVVLLLGWIALAPEAVGGRAIYITTAGESMEPTISENDLVVLRKSTDFEVGDIVAYDVSNSIILHRIIGIDGERVILQGDNNSRPDSIRPTRDEIRGQYWFQLSPPWKWSLSSVASVMSAFAFLTIGGVTAFRTRGRIFSVRSVQNLAAHAKRYRNNERYARLLGPLGQVIVAFIAMLGIGALLLAAVGFSRPLERSVVENIPYHHEAAFDYSAPAAGDVYDDGIAATGVPLYRDLVDTVTFDFHYTLMSESAVRANGVYRVDLVVRNADGWSSTLPLIGDRQFSGDRIDATTIVDLSDVESQIFQFEEQTGLTDSGQPFEYQVAVVSTVRVDGTIAGHQIRDTFNPSLIFDMDERALTPRMPSNGIEESGNEAGAGLAQSVVTNTVTDEQFVANEVAFLGGDLDVSTARQLAIVGLALAIFLGVAVLLMIRAAMLAPEPAQIDARYGSRIVGLRATNLKTSGRMVELAAFEDLVKVADRHDVHILHVQRNGKHFYLVNADEVIYGYQVHSTPQPLDVKLPLDSNEDEALPRGS